MADKNETNPCGKGVEDVVLEERIHSSVSHVLYVDAGGSGRTENMRPFDSLAITLVRSRCRLTSQTTPDLKFVFRLTDRPTTKSRSRRKRLLLTDQDDWSIFQPPTLTTLPVGRSYAREGPVPGLGYGGGDTPIHRFTHPPTPSNLLLFVLQEDGGGGG